jgi:hypothetical protein
MRITYPLEEALELAGDERMGVQFYEHDQDDDTSCFIIPSIKDTDGSTIDLVRFDDGRLFQLYTKGSNLIEEELGDDSKVIERHVRMVESI